MTERTIDDLIAQIRRDLEELEVQIADGDIDAETGERLRQTYLGELDRAEVDRSQRPSEPAARSRGRTVVGAIVLVGALAVSIGVAGQFVQQRDVDTTEGVAGLAGTTDLSQVSDEAMQAVIDTYADDPAVAEQLPRMRFALAERKFGQQDYTAAFEQYDAILSADPPPPANLAAPTLTRVAWIVWLNGETDLALQTVDRSLELVPDDPEARYVRAQILWCGGIDIEEAGRTLEALADDGDLPPDVRTQIEDDLRAIESGAGCIS